MKKQQLQEYCEKHHINVPSQASKETVERIVVRAFLHGKPTPLKQDSCVGFWDQSDNNCHFCQFEEECFKCSFGMEKKTYFKKLDGQRIRTVKTMRIK